jgi:hypothetical protein
VVAVEREAVERALAAEARVRVERAGAERRVWAAAEWEEPAWAAQVAAEPA